MSDNTELESSDSVQSARNCGSGCMSGCGTIRPSLGAEMIPTVPDSVDSAVLSESIDNAVEKPSPISGRWDKSVSLGISGLDQKSLCYWAINLGVGCMHGCLFCYVPEVSTIKLAPKLSTLGVHDPDSEWGQYVFIRPLDEAKLIGELKRAERVPLDQLPPGANRAILLCSTTDPYQVIRNSDPQEQKRLNAQLKEVRRRTLELILELTTLNVRILTRSPLVKEDFDLLRKFGDRVLLGMSIPSLNDKLVRVYEPGAPGGKKRLQILQEARNAGINVYVAVAPTYPDCEENDLRETLKAVKSLDPCSVFMEPINIRADNVGRIESAAQSAGVKINTSVFKSTAAWEKYALDQMQLFERLAGEEGLADCVHIWPDKTLGSKACFNRQPDHPGKDWLTRHWERVSEWPGKDKAQGTAPVSVARTDEEQAPTRESNTEVALPERGCFPVASLPSVIRDYALELAETYKVPVELPALCMIGALSGAIGKSWQVANIVPERITMANLYMVLSLNSGAGKSISNRIAKPITRVEAERVAAFERDEMPRLKTRQIALEAELKRVKKSAKDGPLDEARLQEIVRDLDEVNGALRKSVALIVGNGTTTGLGNELSRVEDETLWVYSAEGGHVVDVMLGSTGKHAPHIELWLNGFSGESYNQTRGRSSAGGANCVLLKSVCLSSLLMIQPVVAQKLIDHKLARERGLLARLLIVEIKTRPRRDDGMVTAVSPALEEAWHRLLEDIFKCRQSPSNFRNLSCSPEAREVFRQFHNDTTCAWSEGVLADMDKELSRWRENAIKIALVLQAATDPAASEISVEVARDAVTLMRWLGIGLLEMAEVNRYERLDRRANQLAQALKKRGGECVASSLETRHGFSLDEAQKLAGMYPQRFRVIEVQRGGRPGNLVKLL